MFLSYSEIGPSFSQSQRSQNSHGEHQDCSHFISDFDSVKSHKLSNIEHDQNLGETSKGNPGAERSVIGDSRAGNTCSWESRLNGCCRMVLLPLCSWRYKLRLNEKWKPWPNKEFKDPMPLLTKKVCVKCDILAKFQGNYNLTPMLLPFQLNAVIFFTSCSMVWCDYALHC